MESSDDKRYVHHISRDSLQLPTDLYWPYASPHYLRASAEQNESREFTLDMSSNSSQLAGRRRGTRGVGCGAGSVVGYGARSGRGRGEGCGARVAPALLLHINLVLALYGGAALATAARLKWDPTLYVALRELFPLEFRALAAALLLGGGALLLLAHLAALAATLRGATARRLLYTLYAVGMGALVVGEVCVCAWASVRVSAWLESSEGRVWRDVLTLRRQLQPYMQHLLPGTFYQLIEEAEADVPRNGYVVLATAALLAVLQPAALLLAVLAAAAAPSHQRCTHYHHPHRNESMLRDESAPLKLKAVYRDGKLILV